MTLGALGLAAASRPATGAAERTSRATTATRTTTTGAAGEAPAATGSASEAATGATRLADLTRYLMAIWRRLERLPHALGADRERMDRVHAVEDAYDDLRRALSPARAAGTDIVDIGWQIEELRVSLWAQQLGTPRPVSEQRIYKAIAAIS